MQVKCKKCQKIKTSNTKWSKTICRTCYKKEWRHKTGKTNTKWKELGLTTKSIKEDLKQSKEALKLLLEKFVKENKPLSQIAKETGISRTTLQRRFKEFNLNFNKPINISKNYENVKKTGKDGIYLAQCKVCGQVLKKIKPDLSLGCGNCLSKGQSAAEAELCESLGIPFVKKYLEDNGRSKEIDIYAKSEKIGIEYCGIYWHSEKFRDKNYHFNKMKLAEKNDIRLITIFEDEWLYRKPQVLNYLKSAFNKNDTNLYARECDFKPISKSESDVFLDKHHIQGKAKLTSYFFGLFYKDELVGVITFGQHHRKNNDKELVLDRLCFKDNFTVVGGASKLFKNAIKIIQQLQQFTKIISWSDNRWSQGKVYQVLGFKLEKALPPDYSYVKNQKRFSKQSLKKTKTEKTSGKTEAQLRSEQGYLRIWDCGKKRWAFLMPTV